jgi:Sulfotransferase domain
MPSHAVIAGVNKAGTTSLFASLSTHPGIAPASIKETRYFLPARYGRPLEPRAVYDGYFADAAPGAVRLEATPSYLYGSAAVARAIDDALPDPYILVILREPVARAISFFRYQKARLRFPSELTLTEYLAEADRLTEADFDDPDNERFMAYRGGCYAEFVPPWVEQFGAARMRFVFFEEMIHDPLPVLRGVASWLDLDPGRIQSDDLGAENRTTGYKSGALQRIALTGNDRFEAFLRRHMGLKRRLRSMYYRVNGQKPGDAVPDDLRDLLTERYREPNATLAAQLSSIGVALPDWLAPATSGQSPP